MKKHYAIVFRFTSDYLTGERPEDEDEEEDQTQLSGSCPASIPPVHPQQPPPVPAQRRYSLYNNKL